MKINKKFGQAITIHWIDACQRISSWMPVSKALQIPDEVYTRTRAFYVGQDKLFLTVACCIGKNKNNDVGGVWHIPKKWIMKVK